MQVGWKQKLAILVAIAVVFIAAVAPIGAQDKPFLEPDKQWQPLKNQFNADVGKVRILFIGDPTCPPCRHGASVIQENVVSRFATDKLAVYVVWVPLLNLQDPATLQRHAHQYAKLIPPGPRVTHYSDAEAFAGKAYGPILGVPYGSPAWDVYMAFGADVRWGDTPPVPNYFEHQLGGLPSEKLLDAPRFAGEAGKLLAKAGQ
jgi:hypothetical protein